MESTADEERASSILETSLSARVEALEIARHYQIQDKDETSEDDDADLPVIDEPMRRARLAVESSPLYSAYWKVVPQPDYYTWTLEQRAKYLMAPSIHYLCKSLLMENRKCVKEDPTNPRFFLVVLQYAATLDTLKTIQLLRSLRRRNDHRLEASDFDLRLASTEDNDRLTGFSHNSVSPFGLLHTIPILLADAVLPLNYIWMGGGGVHVKLRVGVSDFIRAVNPIVGDISRPRINFMDRPHDINDGLDD
jgi:hypothetical protein